MLCFRKFPVAKKFMDKRGGGIKTFRRTFLSRSAEKCRRGTLLSFINFGYRKSLDERVGVGEVSRFSVEIFVSHSAEKFRRATLQGVTSFGYRKILCFRGLCHNFLSKFLSHSAEKLRRGTLLCCVSENFR